MSKKKTESEPIKKTLISNFEKTGGFNIPFELLKDYSAYCTDKIKSTFWKIKSNIVDTSAAIKVRKNYKVEYNENPANGEPFAKIIPKEL